MNYREMKTVTLLLKPTENGWTAAHKKLKTPYGTVTCTERGKTISVKMCFGENVPERAEAMKAVLRVIFESTEAETVIVDGEFVSRAVWLERQEKTLSRLCRTKADYDDVLGKPVHCVMDRPLGSAHPRYPEMIYPVNYGYVPGLIAGDGSEQDVYVLGPEGPLESFDGVVIAVIHRFDDCEDKWVVAEKAGLYTEAEIREILDFQEKYYTSQILMA